MQNPKVIIGEDKSGNCYSIHYGEFRTVRYVVKDSKEVEDEILVALCEYILTLEFALESHTNEVTERAFEKGKEVGKTEERNLLGLEVKK